MYLVLTQRHPVAPNSVDSRRSGETVRTISLISNTPLEPYHLAVAQVRFIRLLVQNSWRYIVKIRVMLQFYTQMTQYQNLSLTSPPEFIYAMMSCNRPPSSKVENTTYLHLINV